MGNRLPQTAGTASHIIMQSPTDQAETTIPTKTVMNDPNLSRIVPDLTKMQCHNRWRYALDPSIALTAGSTGTWTEDEDLQLKDSVQTHGGKDWGAIAVLVPGRTKMQCLGRWHNALGPSITLTNGRTGIKWTDDEDIQLEYAVHVHGDKDWPTTAVLVPGRTDAQCRYRWKKLSEHSPVKRTRHSQ
jgi:myb proto-oncogene protein